MHIVPMQVSPQRQLGMITIADTKNIAMHVQYIQLEFLYEAMLSAMWSATL